MKVLSFSLQLNAQGNTKGNVQRIWTAKQRADGKRSMANVWGM